MPDPPRFPWTGIALVALFLTPLAVGFALESQWLTQVGFIVLGLFILALYQWERLQRQREVRQNMERIFRARVNRDAEE
jgi:hypothetical protein